MDERAHSARLEEDALEEASEPLGSLVGPATCPEAGEDRGDALLAENPWVASDLASRLARPGMTEEEVAAELDREAYMSSGLPARQLSRWLRGEAAPEELRAVQPAWDLVASRLADVLAAQPDLPPLTAVRMAWADGRLPLAPGESWDGITRRAGELRSRWPALNKRAARAAARFGLDPDALARLRPGRYGHLPLAQEILREHPELHRKLARLLASRGAAPAEIRQALQDVAESNAIWREVMARGPLTLVTYGRVLDAEPELDPPHPFVLKLRDGTVLPKVEVLAGFSAADRGAALGRMKPTPEVREPATGPAREAGEPVRHEPVLSALADGRRVRFLLRDGRGVTGIPRRASRYEYLIEIKGGVRVALYRHGLAGVVPERAPDEAAPKQGESRRGRKGQKRRKGGR